MSSEDDELIQRFLADDPQAMKTVDAWILQATRTFRYRLGNDYEDAQQDIRIEIHKLLKSENFRLESNLKAYLQTVARHTCLDRIRSVDRRGNYLLEKDSEQIYEQLEKDGVSVSSRAPQHEQRDLMQKVLAAMPEDCWQIWSKIIIGFSYAEISQELGIREGTLRVRAKRCREKAIETRQRLLEGEIPSKASRED